MPQASRAESSPEAQQSVCIFAKNVHSEPVLNHSEDKVSFYLSVYVSLKAFKSKKLRIALF